MSSRMQRSKRYKSFDIASTLLLVIGIVVIGAVLAIILRVQRGLIGVLLAGVAVGLLAYWLREIRRVIQAERPQIKPRQPEWTYDILDGQEEIAVVAEVPGPEDQVRVTLQGSRLEIHGGNNFRKDLQLPSAVDLAAITYRNGVLNVRLRKRPSPS